MNQTNPMNQTNTSDIHALVERDRGMMVELEKMKEERRRIIESITKDDKMTTKRSDTQNTVNKNKNKLDFDMIRSEFKTDSKGYRTTERTKSQKNTNKLKVNNSVNNIKNTNEEPINQDKNNNLKKQLSFSNIMKSKKPSVAEELIKKQQSELTFQPKTNKMPD